MILAYCSYALCAELQFCVVMMQRSLRNVATDRRHEVTGYWTIATD